MLKDENIDVLFLTDTDTIALENENSYAVEGYNTILPLRKSADSKVRIIGLIKKQLNFKNQSKKWVNNYILNLPI